jgi:hypothetical protein
LTRWQASLSTPRVGRGVVAAQDLVFPHTEPGEASVHLQAHAEEGSGLAGGDAVNHLVVLGELDHATASLGQVLGAPGDQLHHRVELEVAGGDLGLGLDDRPQVSGTAAGHARHIGRVLPRI